MAFAVSVSMSKIFAKKHNYEIDSDQVIYLWNWVENKNTINKKSNKLAKLALS